MKHLLFVVLLVLTCSCQDNVSEGDVGMHLSLVTRAVSQDDFDWEMADFMPVPQGMTPVNSPWIGAGSLIGSYDLDVVNDRKNQKDGFCCITLLLRTLQNLLQILILYFIISIVELCVFIIMLRIVL